ncbi:nuclear RNA export factor 1-like [Nylanderia fulva]|uniref:nuclear RNA export factor 1-like n=1 Tax=Nylanderia fulva TaxID=613905 RepID=UPI0010FB77C7|nr:nuclear RNA export factor 1-like [Nylanderia fulva]
MPKELSRSCRLRSINDLTNDFIVNPLTFRANVLRYFESIDEDDVASNKLFPRSVQSSSIKRFVENRLPQRRNFQQKKEYNKKVQIKRVQNLYNEFSWYRINISYGHKYEKEYIIKSILNYIAPEVFVAIMYKRTENGITFFVDDYKTAHVLSNCNRKIAMRDGFILQMYIRQEYPRYEISDKYKERVKQTIFKRYVQETNALDLSQFHLDPDLVDDYFCALCHPVILFTVLNIVGEYIPTLEFLNLESNKLQNIDRLVILNKKFSNLKILYISDNKIKDIYELEAIKNLKLEELKLAGNPVCNNYEFQQSEYICDIQKWFPKLLRLDDKELPRPIEFDVIEAAKIPQSQRILFTDTKVQQIACHFLQQYFTILDSENRQLLLDAYEKEARFSMTINNSHANKLIKYLINSRNLFRIYDTTRRQQLLKYGRLPIVSFISQLPQTRHLLDTFTMDVVLVAQTMMFITITGYFQELNDKEQFIRHFNRTFIIVQEGAGYCIRNEQLHINYPTEAQLKELSQQMQPKTPEPIETVQKPIAPVLTEDMRQMIATLSQQTNMNLNWSLKCLQEMEWNYDNALTAFQNFFKCGQIPSEAFTKCT